MQWFYADKADKQHEFPEESFPSLISDNLIARDTLVWNETMPDWQPCVDVRPDLFDGIPLPPALTPAQQKQVRTAQPEVSNGPPSLDTVALCALIFGVLGLVCFQLFAIPAVICGHIGLKRANDEPGNSSNKGFSIAGIITGYLGILILVAIIIFYGAAFAIGISESMNDSG
ncbi:MAG: DUF4190 domain-containing protein [Verrucomicrobiales bacterium]|nr:DUF4190 domain-containing protein [Verrucomicrobiales bacterium]